MLAKNVGSLFQLVIAAASLEPDISWRPDLHFTHRFNTGESTAATKLSQLLSVTVSYCSILMGTVWTGLVTSVRHNTLPTRQAFPEKTTKYI